MNSENVVRGDGGLGLDRVLACQGCGDAFMREVYILGAGAIGPSVLERQGFVGELWHTYIPFDNGCSEWLLVMIW